MGHPRRFGPTIECRRSTLAEPTRTPDGPPPRPFPASGGWRFRLVVEDLSVAYGGSTVVRNASLRVGQGGAVALLRRKWAREPSTLMALARAITPRPGAGRVDRPG